jgi:signal transduction histidine kinase
MLEGARGPLVAPAIAKVIILLAIGELCAFSLIHAVVSNARWSPLTVGYVVISLIVVGLEIFGLARLARLITELHAARAELANAAVAHERLRFAKDLHDLLGLSLSAIAPKGELACRLVAKNPERARQELGEIHDIAQRAVAGARELARGYRDLDAESKSAESLLAASSVDVRMDVNHGELPIHIRTALAAVLRAGVANVLEHSAAARCDIVMRQAGRVVSLDIVNDGVGPDLNPAAGSGLRLLAGQAESLGGRLTAGLDRDGRFRVHLTLPVSGKVTRETEDAIPRTATRLARTLVAVVFCGLTLLGSLDLLGQVGDASKVVAGAGYLAGLLAIQLCYFGRPGTSLRSPSSYALLAVQAILVALSAQFGVPWLALPGFLAGSVLLVAPLRSASLLFAAIVAGVAVQSALTGAVLEAVANTTATAATGAVVYGLTWMTRSLSELRDARRRLAQAAVEQERLRLARDLHDLLGLSLSAITLKSELAQRLVGHGPDRARVELAEILDIARRALADVRLVACGDRQLSLSDECRTAESLLVAAEVKVRLEVCQCELSGQVGTLLATVLREGVTNVLRHSKGESCEIIVEQTGDMVSLEIVNDGVHNQPTLAGTGLHNLTHRVRLVGGEVTAGIEPDGRFRLRALVPA